MSDNKLLSENTIRRFMKLANTEALSNNFLAEDEGKKKKYDRAAMDAAAQKAREDAKKKGEKGSVAGKGVASMLKQEQDEDEQDTLEETEEFDLEGLEEQEDDLMADEEPEEEMDMPEDPMAGAEDDAIGAADMSLTEEEARVLVSLGERLAEALGGAEDDLDDMGDEDVAEEPPMDDAAELEGPEDPEEDEAALGGYAMRGAMEESTQNEIVQEVLKRVTKRLVSEKLRK